MTLTVQKTTDTSFLKDVETGLESHAVKTMGKTKTPVYFVVQDGADIKGGMKASYVGASFFVSWLQVDESLRGQGWGTKLMAAAEEEARKLGCKKMFVDTMAFQAPKFYAALGFKQCACIPGYYDGYDRIFFQKELKN